MRPTPLQNAPLSPQERLLARYAWELMEERNAEDGDITGASGATNGDIDPARERLELARLRVRADRIVQLCFLRQISQADLAKESGVGRTVLSAKLRNKRRWYADELISVADVLGTSVAYLVGETDQTD